MEDKIDLLEKLKNDKHVLEVMKEPFILETIDIKQYMEKLNNLLLENYPSILKSIKILETKYRDILSGKERLIKNIKKVASYYDDLNKLWIEINDDNRILNSFSKIIALWLTADLDPIEKANIYSEITEEIRNSDKNKIIKSIEIIKNEYALIYNFNSDYFKKIISMVTNPNEFNKITTIDNDKNSKKHKQSKLFGFLRS